MMWNTILRRFIIVGLFLHRSIYCALLTLHGIWKVVEPCKAAPEDRSAPYRYNCCFQRFNQIWKSRKLNTLALEKNRKMEKVFCISCTPLSLWKSVSSLSGLDLAKEKLKSRFFSMACFYNVWFVCRMFRSSVMVTQMKPKWNLNNSALSPWKHDRHKSHDDLQEYRSRVRRKLKCFLSLCTFSFVEIQSEDTYAGKWVLFYMLQKMHFKKFQDSL